MAYTADLPSGYIYDIARPVVSSEGATTIRCNISSDVEWRSWLKMFEAGSNQKFVVKRTYNELVR
jgi:hypothetical protein